MTSVRLRDAAPWLGLLLFGFGASACDSTSAGMCIPGESRECTGAGGCAGGQVCNAEGTGLGPCECGPGGADAGGDVDAGGATCSIFGDWRLPHDEGFDSYIRLRSDGTYGIAGHPDDLPPRSNGTFEVMGDTLSISDNEGMDCPTPGVYTFAFDASCDRLTFTELDEACMERSRFLTSRELIRYTDTPPPPPPPVTCIETTFEITNWPGAGASNSLYTGTSWELDDCTMIQPDPLIVTIRCPVDSFGQTRLISEGCGVLGVAAPGNVLSDVGASPSSGTACAGQVVDNETIRCSQECRGLLNFRITSGPC